MHKYNQLCLCTYLNVSPDSSLIGREYFLALSPPISDEVYASEKKQLQNNNIISICDECVFRILQSKLRYGKLEAHCSSFEKGPNVNQRV